MSRKTPRATSRSARGSSAKRALEVSLALLMALITARPVHAQDAAAIAIKERQFREQVDGAERAYNVRDYAAAAEKLRAAFAIEPVPLILFNIAQAYRKLAAYSDARVYYELYRSTDKNLSSAEVTTVDRHIADMREGERAAKEPRVINKTKLLYLQSEKPPPRWLFPVGLSSGIVGLGGLAAGAALLAIDGRCAIPAEAPALECDRVHSTRLPGAMFAVVGGSMVVIGVALVALSARRPTRPVLTETKDVPDEDALRPLLESYRRSGGERPRPPKSDGVNVPPSH